MSHLSRLIFLAHRDGTRKKRLCQCRLCRFLQNVILHRWRNAENGTRKTPTACPICSISRSRTPKCYPPVPCNICNIFERYIAYVTFQSSKIPCFIEFIERSFLKVTLLPFLHVMLHLLHVTFEFPNRTRPKCLCSVRFVRNGSESKCPIFFFHVLTEGAKSVILESVKEPLWGLTPTNPRP